jgi:hypothetical protein
MKRIRETKPALIQQIQTAIRGSRFRRPDVNSEVR